MDYWRSHSDGRRKPGCKCRSNHCAMTTGDPDLLGLYRKMQMIRICEERLAKSHQRGLIHGGWHTYVGPEAIAGGVCAHLRQEYPVFSTHRGHGHALAKGLEPKQLFAELYGRASGCS